MLAGEVESASVKLLDGLPRDVPLTDWRGTNVDRIVAIGSPPLAQQRQERRRQRHQMITAPFVLALHPVARNGPRRGVQVEFGPEGADDLADALAGESAKKVRPANSTRQLGHVCSAQHRSDSLRFRDGRQMLPRRSAPAPTRCRQRVDRDQAVLHRHIENGAQIGAVIAAIGSGFRSDR